MSHINSRYHLLTTLARDVVRKVDASFEHHQHFKTSLAKANEWIDNVQTVVNDCDCVSTNSEKETLETHFDMIQSLISKQEEGQNLVSQALNWGEKVLRNTRTTCTNEQMNEKMDELQSDWDKLIKKMSGTKVTLETSLLEWTDMNASYSNMQQWINERCVQTGLIERIIEFIIL